MVGKSLSPWTIWQVVQAAAGEIGVERFARTIFAASAKLCRKSGGNLEQIKCLLGHASIQTTEHYLGAEQELGILNCFVSCRMRIRTRPDSRECSPQGAVQSSGGPLELSRPGRPREDSVDEPMPA